MEELSINLSIASTPVIVCADREAASSIAKSDLISCTVNFNVLSLRFFILSFYMFSYSSAYLFNSLSCRALVGVMAPMRCTFKNSKNSSLAQGYRIK